MNNINMAQTASPEPPEDPYCRLIICMTSLFLGMALGYVL